MLTAAEQWNREVSIIFAISSGFGSVQVPDKPWRGNANLTGESSISKPTYPLVSPLSGLYSPSWIDGNLISIEFIEVQPCRLHGERRGRDAADH